MHVRKTQAIALAVAGLMLVAGFASVLLGGRGTMGVQAASEHTIEILASGFNPELCQVNRNDSTVFFFNKDNKTRRVLWADPNAGEDTPPLYDREIAPGETVVFTIVTSQVDIRYSDPTTGHEGRILAPMDNGAQANCSPLPPTPTPTNTPTVTPTPTATPTAPPRPPACTRLLSNPLGCLIAIWVSSDGPLQ